MPIGPERGEVSLGPRVTDFKASGKDRCVKQEFLAPGWADAVRVNRTHQGSRVWGPRRTILFRSWFRKWLKPVALLLPSYVKPTLPLSAYIYLGWVSDTCKWQYSVKSFNKGEITYAQEIGEERKGDLLIKTDFD